MNLIPLEFEAPAIVSDVYELAKKMMSRFPNHDAKKDVVVAGGCLSNSYMGEAINDVDVFLEFRLEYAARYAEEIADIFSVAPSDVSLNIGLGYEHFACPLLFRLTYKNTPVEFIFNRSIERVYDFDIRLRQFYLVNDQVWATQEALDDIENKRLVLSCPYSPIRTFVRMTNFKEQFGFEIDPESENLLLSLLSIRPFEYDRFVASLNDHKKLHPIAKQTLQQFADDHVTPEGVIQLPERKLPFSEPVNELFTTQSQSSGISRNVYGRDYGVFGKNFEEIKKYTPSNDAPDEIVLQYDLTNHAEIILQIIQAIQPSMDDEFMEKIIRHMEPYTELLPPEEVFENGKERLQYLKEELRTVSERMKYVFSGAGEPQDKLALFRQLRTLDSFTKRANVYKNYLLDPEKTQAILREIAEMQRDQSTMDRLRTVYTRTDTEEFHMLKCLVSVFENIKMHNTSIDDDGNIVSVDRSDCPPHLLTAINETTTSLLFNLIQVNRLEDTFSSRSPVTVSFSKLEGLSLRNLDLQLYGGYSLYIMRQHLRSPMDSHVQVWIKKEGDKISIVLDEKESNLVDQDRLAQLFMNDIVEKATSIRCGNKSETVEIQKEFVTKRVVS